MSETDAFSTIIVPLDGSEQSMRAAKSAVMVAAKYGASVTAVYVVNIDQYLQSFGLYRLSYPDVVKKKIEEAEAEAKGWFAEIQNIADRAGVSFSHHVIDTPHSVVAAIIEYAENEKASLIVIGTRGRSGFKKLLLGSVASGVVTYATCPVLVVR
ncbi:MAG: universal stress protein [Nitrososphaera sp.]|jgi:nucleotide-binding universal stress UspA family protein